MNREKEKDERKDEATKKAQKVYDLKVKKKFVKVKEE